MKCGQQTLLANDWQFPRAHAQSWCVKSINRLWPVTVKIHLLCRFCKENLQAHFQQELRSTGQCEALACPMPVSDVRCLGTARSTFSYLDFYGVLISGTPCLSSKAMPGPLQKGSCFGRALCVAAIEASAAIRLVPGTISNPYLIWTFPQDRCMSAQPGGRILPRLCCIICLWLVSLFQSLPDSASFAMRVAAYHLGGCTHRSGA